MVEGLQNKFQSALKTLRGEAKIKPEHIEGALQELRKSLLEADVSLKVVKSFLERMKAQALGEKVLGSLKPYEQFMYLLQKEMMEIFGETKEFDLKVKPPAIILMAGLQGTGKTTSSAKLAHYLRRKLKKKAVLVSVDVQRPAAIEQLERLASDIKVDYFNTDSMVPLERAQKAIEYARMYGSDAVIIDTAGRLSIDEDLMAELEELHAKTKPHHVFYVADAMSGQAGLQVAEGFAKRVGLTAAILTKTDADARGGVAFSIREALGVPLQFVGAGEKMEEFELFHADRWVGRILGQGDLKSLVEKVEDVTKQAAAQGIKPEKAAKRALKGQMNLIDFQEQMKMMSKMGSLKGLMGMIPGMSQMAGQLDTDQMEKRLKRIDAMINSMTPGERKKPDVIDGSRKRRIAKGSGTKVEEINAFLKEFWQMQKMMKQFKGMKGLKGMPGLGKLFG